MVNVVAAVVLALMEKAKFLHGENRRSANAKILFNPYHEAQTSLSNFLRPSGPRQK